MLIHGEPVHARALSYGECGERGLRSSSQQSNTNNINNTKSVHPFLCTIPSYDDSSFHPRLPSFPPSSIHPIYSFLPLSLTPYMHVDTFTGPIPHNEERRQELKLSVDSSDWLTIGGVRTYSFLCDNNHDNNLSVGYPCRLYHAQ